jgi:phosphate-selective porin OprO/OprP
MTGQMVRAVLVAAVVAAGALAQPPTLPGTVLPQPQPPDTPATTLPPAAEGKKADDQKGQPPDTDEAIKKASEVLAKPLRLQPTFEMRGRIETEVVVARQSEESRESIGSLVNGYGFRRVRLGAQGSIGDSASWVSEVELAGGNVRLRDVFVGLDAFQGVRQVRVGHFREPYSLEGMTSTNFITFLERSPQNVLSPARNWGVCGFWWPDDERVLFTLGAFRDGTESNGQSIGNGNNWAFTARLTALPVDEQVGDEVRLVHVGGAFSQRVPPDGLINFTPRTGSNLLTVEDNPGSPFLPAVDIFANCYQLYNVQAAGVLGSFSIQGEWSAAQVQQTNAGGVFVHGAYLYGTYFLTGEHRGYNRTRGSFDAVNVFRPLIRDRTDPRGGFGAVELAARLGFLDFDDTNLPPDVNGMPSSTKLYEATVGVNWYLNRNTRIMLNYTAAIPDRMTTTVAHTFGLRTAIFW